jgi:hypothetical protein
MVALPSATQAVSSLIFERPPSQAPGTVNQVSDPTIQPFIAPGSPAPILERAAIDLQGNGRPDAVVCHGSFPPSPAVKGPCRVLRPQPDGSLVDVTRQLFGTGSLPTATHPREIVSGDFNRDGRADIYVAAHGYDAAPFSGETNLLLVSNADGTYTDRSATLPQTPDFTHSATVGDINGDGNPDIYVGNWGGGGAPTGPYFLVGRGDGTFAQTFAGLPLSITMSADPPSSSREIFSACLLVDLDGDTFADLVLGTAPTQGHNQNIVLFNDGTGDFTRRSRLVLPPGPLPADDFAMMDIASLDVNRDGRPDLLMLSSALKTVSGVGLQVLINQGTGTFLDETTTRLGTPVARLTGPWSPFIRLVDLNGDGLQDFYLEIFSIDDVPPRFWLNNGNGTFTAVASIAASPELNIQSLLAVDFDGDQRPDFLKLLGSSGFSISYRSFLNHTPRTVFATMALSQSRLNFGAVNDGSVLTSRTPTQRLTLTQSGPGTVTWTATASQPWITVSPASGTGAAIMQVSLASAGVPLSGVLSGTITVTTTGATNSPAAAVFLSVLTPGQSAAPLGSFDTPADNSAGVTGSVAVTGWAIDDIGVQKVDIVRDPVATEGTAPVFIGTAALVDGARPDVAAANPTKPRSSQAGWGYLMLTNFLPNQGNGTFRITAIATDVEGKTTTLGSRTITCTNASATKPFGAIDTPGQGEVVSGSSYANFGWVLAPGSVGAAPPDGGTVTAFIDGAPIGTPAGWTSRADLTALFPAATYPNVSKALAVIGIDTTTLANGVHTIFWVVTATNEQTDGIGSRFFTVANSSVFAGSGVQDPGIQDSEGRGSSVRLEAPAWMAPARSSALALRDEVNAAPQNRTALAARRGFDLRAPFRSFSGDASGRTTIEGEELDRFEVQLAKGSTGYLRVGDDLRPLPIGSRLDEATGVFTWASGVGFVHEYDLVFVQRRQGRAVLRQDVRFVLQPKQSNRVGPQVVIDAPASAQATAGEPVSVGRSFLVAGWAVDLDETVGTGVDTLHVWAYPASACGPREESESSSAAARASGGGAPLASNKCDPIFIGPAAYGGSRPDVAAIFGDQFRTSGYGIIVDSLPSGTYDVAVFAWSTVRDGFVPAKTVRVTVR